MSLIKQDQAPRRTSALIISEVRQVLTATSLGRRANAAGENDSLFKTHTFNDSNIERPLKDYYILRSTTIKSRLKEKTVPFK